MAYPNGYTVIGWNVVHIGDEIYILEDNRPTPYGPYKVLDTQTRECDDLSPNAAVFGSTHMTIGAGEVIGVPINSPRATAGQSQTYNSSRPVTATANTQPGIHSKLLATDIYRKFLDGIIMELAAQNPNLTPGEKHRLGQQAAALQDSAVDALADIIRRIP